MGETFGIAGQHPFTGFDVIALAYPNHADPAELPLTSQGVCRCLIETVAQQWLLADPGSAADWEISEPIEGRGEHAGECSFWLGPFDEDTQDFVDPIITLVRETAGGG